MYNYQLHTKINQILQLHDIDIAGEDNLFYTRFIANAAAIHNLYNEIYGQRNDNETCFEKFITSIVAAHVKRPQHLKDRDESKNEKGHWFLGNELAGMSLYVDRFCGSLSNLTEKLDYFSELGVNLLHLMPVFQSPQNASDGGYAVSDFRKIDDRFGDLQDLYELQNRMQIKGMYLMLDMVLNHTSDQHAWALRAKDGDPVYQDYYYFFDDRKIPDQFDSAMPEVFPQSAPGSFTFNEDTKKWVMTVFHNYQWDLNYRNPAVFIEMLDNVFFYANLGVDILRLDAPAFIWKEIGTSCQNLPKAHTLLRLIKQAVQIATPGMAILGEAIVAPKEIMKYFGTGTFTARECDFAYNATHMALQWDALATGDVKVMMIAQHDLLQKPYGTSWITYTRCHDDIGLGYDDYMITQSGFEPFQHRKFIKDYYIGNYPNSNAKGALFSSNPKTGDARISGTLASLCGLESALENKNPGEVEISIRKILLMQAHSFFISGLPMLFYGDELGYLNDYSYLNDPAKSYDNRWMHRPLIDWDKNNKRHVKGTPEERIFSGTRKLLSLRRSLTEVADLKNLTWLNTMNKHIAGYLRTREEKKLWCFFNFSNKQIQIDWHIFEEYGAAPGLLLDFWSGQKFEIGSISKMFVVEPYQFLLLSDEFGR